MIQIGITGGIGSGKSTVCKIFASIGIPINDADTLAKEIIVSDSELKYSIIKHFGEESYFENGEYNRSHISKIVFNDAEKLSTLNSLVHPKVIEHSKIWADKHAHLPYIIKEAALMFESGSYQFNDYNIVVEAPLEKRIERICKRDLIDKETALKRINSQMNDADRNALADLIIYNNDKQSLIHQVYSIHKKILENNDPR